FRNISTRRSVRSVLIRTTVRKQWQGGLLLKKIKETEKVVRGSNAYLYFDSNYCDGSGDPRLYYVRDHP
ncbi:MAG: hypothetical protein ACI4NE_06160, partial [Succinivibrio sp.]